MRGLGGGSRLNKYTSGGFAYGIEYDISDLYTNICANYEKGDEIYIIGFSRGAVVAGALSGLLSYGILKAQHIQYIKSVWQLYYLSKRDLLFDHEKIRLAESQELVDRHRHQDCVKVRFLGVFDTVMGGRGWLANLQRFQLRHKRVAPCVINAVQILALDETRLFFENITWEGAYSVDTVTEQIWMPGVHSDIGGTYPQNCLGDAALLVMIDRLMSCTSLNIDISPLLYRLENYNDRIVVNDEYEETRWRVFSPFHRVRRQGAYREFIHPIASELSSRTIVYKKNKELTKKNYRAACNLTECEYFKSSSLKGRKVVVLD